MCFLLLALISQCLSQIAFNFIISCLQPPVEFFLLFTLPSAFQLRSSCETLDLFQTWNPNLLFLDSSFNLAAPRFLDDFIITLSLTSEQARGVKGNPANLSLLFFLLFCRKQWKGGRKWSIFNYLHHIFDLQIASITRHNIPCKIPPITMPLMFVQTPLWYPHAAIMNITSVSVQHLCHNNTHYCFSLCKHTDSTALFQAQLVYIGARVEMCRWFLGFRGAGWRLVHKS